MAVQTGEDKPLLPYALKILLPVANDWQTIGTLMHVPSGILRNISTTERGVPINCLRVMLEEMLKLTDPAPTWKALAEAVKPIDPIKAKEIREKYHVKEDDLTSNLKGQEADNTTGVGASPTTNTSENDVSSTSMAKVGNGVSSVSVQNSSQPKGVAKDGVGNGVSFVSVQNSSQPKGVAKDGVGNGVSSVSVQNSSQPKEDSDDYEGLHYEPEMKDLMNEVGVMLGPKWRDIGRGLKLKEWQLDNIGYTHRNNPVGHAAMSAVFNEWHSNAAPEFTWATILKVICSNAVNGKEVAKKLKKELPKKA